LAFLDSFPERAGPPDIFNRYPEIYRPWADLSQALMNGPSPFSRAERELLLAFAAGSAGCDFVAIAHAEVAYALGIVEGQVEALLDDITAASRNLDSKLVPILTYVRKLAADPASVARDDVDAILAAGWNEQAVHDAAAITARAAFMQRLVMGHGFEPLPRDLLRKHAERRIEQGYVKLYGAFRDRPEQA
jgi:alkylhydroperoxidase family enzyme